MKIYLIILLFIPYLLSCQPNTINTINPIKKNTKSISVGAESTSLYINSIQGKSIALVVNQSSKIKNTHIVDSLLSLGINIKKILSPEHGFRGNVGAGEHIDNSIDAKTSLPIISLYGSHKKPTYEDLKDIDVLIFDLQDVGTRFYTYLSTLHLCVEACAEFNKKLIVLDRPNPNGHYVDGPVLKKEHSSFVGMDPIPIVHGMTLGEYAQMLNGEYWLKDSLQCNLEIIPIKNYDHKMYYSLSIAPSPNLPNDIAINLYPSLCLFEGTKISIGRGTSKPFQIYGHPDFKNFDTIFIPKPIKNAAPKPKLEGKECKGYDLSKLYNDNSVFISEIKLEWLIDAYQQSAHKEDFFNSFFYKLAGNKELRTQIESEKSIAEIKESWQKDIIKFKKIRKKYLLYNDFE